MAEPGIRQIQVGAGRESGPGIRVWTVSGERVTVNYVELQPGAVTKVDHHSNEQINYVLEGRIEVRLGPDGGICQSLERGATVIVPPHVEHQFRALGGAAAMLGIISPARIPQSA
ncbi:MAG TPA: cupin domain-containing protein [bacterium]|nr:cupin domain-containing protein [bacterium]